MVRYLALFNMLFLVATLSNCSQGNQDLRRDDQVGSDSNASKAQRNSEDNKAVIVKADDRKSFIDYCLVDDRPVEIDKTVSILLSIVDEKLCGIAQAKIGRLDAINLIGADISEVRPLRFFTSVEAVDLRFNRIEDITPLSTMISLKSLALDSNPLKTTGDLSSLQNLSSLSLKQTPVDDLKGLAGLVSLREIYLDSSAVKSLEGLEQLFKLERLHADITSISDLEPIKQLTQLRSLRLSGTKVEDLSLLKDLNLLEELDLSNTPLALDPSLINAENCPQGDGVAEVLASFCASASQP